MLRQWALAAALAVTVPAGATACGCPGKGSCASTVSFSFEDVINSFPNGSRATACVGNQCDTPSPGQITAKVFLNEDPPSEVDAKLTVKSPSGEVLFERTAKAHLKSHKGGRLCSTACRTGGIEFRR